MLLSTYLAESRITEMRSQFELTIGRGVAGLAAAKPDEDPPAQTISGI